MIYSFGGYYIVMKKNKLFLHTTYMEAQNLMVNERNQTQKSTQYLIPFHLNSKTVNNPNVTILIRISILGVPEWLSH